MLAENMLSQFSAPYVSTDTLVLAVSGGVDSMVLLDLVSRNHPYDKIVVAHFDHSLRWDESDGDRDFVAEFCKRANLLFEFEKVDIRTLSEIEHMSIESSARKYRYAFLTSIAERHQARYILTAHHLDDRIETAIFNLIRGSKLGGIHAMREFATRNSQFTILRPLLQTTKEDILLYAEREGILYREDSSNTNPTYLRNHLRHNILPLFSQINPQYRRALENFITYTEDLKDWIDAEIHSFLRDEEAFLVSDFEKQSLFFQKEMIRSLYESTNSGTIGLSEGNIEELRRYILTASGATEKHLGELKLRKKWGIIFLSAPVVDR